MRVPDVVWRMLSVAVGVAAIAAAAPRPAAAQGGTATVRGTVTDSTTQQPVANAQVQVVGTTRGTVTNATGQYTIRVPEGAVTLRVQRIGFAPVTRTITAGAGATATVDFLMRPVAATLSQVVVVGYGSRSRAEVTGALATVGGEEIINTPVAGLDAALQGKAPGIQVTQNAGNPGNGITVRVRGAASVSAGNQPLYVVDGIPVQSEDFSQIGLGGQDLTAVTSLNPDEIETITVLKDAASSAIYGSRAANGVILITTKRGVAGGQPRITLNAYTGMQSVPRQVPLLNSKQYIAYMAEGALNDGYTQADLPDFGLVPGVNDTLDNNWQSAIFRTSPVRDVTLGASGGTDRAKYYVSGSYFDQQGVVIGSAYNRASGRANFDFTASDRLSVSTSIGLSRESNFRIEGDNTLDGAVTNALGNPPQFPVSIAGRYTNPDDGLVYTNSVALARLNSQPTGTRRTIGNIEARYQLTRSLMLTGRAGTDQLTMNERRYESPLVIGQYAASVNGVGISAFNSGNRVVGEGFLTYDRAVGEGSNVSVTAGTSIERNRRVYNYLRGESFSNAAFQDPGSAAKITAYDAARIPNNLVSYFTRANLAIAGRYLASASIRADGSSRFGQNNRFGVFPAASLGWVITDEPMARFLSRAGSIKLRASVGTTGNERIGDFAYLARDSSANYGDIPGVAPVSLANPNLRWESNREVDLGFDWTMLGGRIGLIGDYYNKKTSNLLVFRPVASTSGFSNFWDNIGNVENRGFEFQLTTDNVRSRSGRGFSWRTDANISTNRNRITKLYSANPITAGIRGANVAMAGAPLGAFYLIRFDSVNSQTGDAVYFDKNKDGAITPADRVVAGNPQPTYWGGVTNTFSLGNFDLRTFVQFSGGNKIFNAIRIFADDGGYYYDNKLARVLRRWQKPGDVTDEPRASFDGTSGARTVSTRFLESGSYTRLQEITLGYRLPAGFSRLGGMRDTRLYVSGRNLYTFTGYSGYTPDVNSNGSGSNIALGTDFYAYPIPRTWSIGVTTAF